MSTSALKNRVRHYRFLAGEMTQRDLAEQTGVSRQTIVAVETRRFRPSVELALRMADALGVTVEDLFQLSDDPEE